MYKLYRHFAEKKELSDMETLHSVQKVAETLSLSPWTIRKYIYEGKIKAVRIGRRVLIESEEISRLIAEGRRISERYL
jgi:excisionase family DNA binding protein